MEGINMTRKKLFRTGILLILGIFVLGASIPVMAAVDDNAAGNARGYGLSQRAQNMIKSLADLTGLDISAIQSERCEGKSILDIASENGVDKETLTAKITERNQNRLQALLDEGTISQEQYDSCLTQMDQRIQERMERTATGSTGKGRAMGQKFHQGQKGGLGGQQGAGNTNCPLQQPTTD